MYRPSSSLTRNPSAARRPRRYNAHPRMDPHWPAIPGHTRMKAHGVLVISQFVSLGSVPEVNDTGAPQALLAEDPPIHTRHRRVGHSEPQSGHGRRAHRGRRGHQRRPRGPGPYWMLSISHEEFTSAGFGVAPVRRGGRSASGRRPRRGRRRLGRGAGRVGAAVGRAG